MEANDDYIWLTAAAQSEATSAVGGGDVAVLAATVAHDLGSVLGSIRAVAQATRSEQDPAERDIDIETILDAASWSTRCAIWSHPPCITPAPPLARVLGAPLSSHFGLHGKNPGRWRSR